MSWINVLPKMFRADEIIARAILKPKQRDLFVNFHYKNEEGEVKGGLMKFSEVFKFSTSEFEVDERCIGGDGMLYEQITGNKVKTVKTFLLFNGTPQQLKCQAQGYEILDLDFRIS